MEEVAEQTEQTRVETQEITNTEQQETQMLSIDEVNSKYVPLDSISEKYIPLETLSEKYIPKEELNNYISKDKIGETYVEKEKAYANPFIKELDAMIRNEVPLDKINTFFNLSVNDIDKMDGTEALVTKMMYEYGLSRADAQKKVNSNFPTLDNLMNRYDEEEAQEKHQLNEIEKKIQSDEAKKYLSGIRKGISDEIKKREEQNIPNVLTAERKQQIYTAWDNKNFNTKINESIKTFDFQLQDEKSDIDYSISIPVPEDFAKTIVDNAKKFASDNGIEYNDETEAEFIKMAKESYLVQNHQQIMESIVRDVIAKNTKSIVDKYNINQEINRQVERQNNNQQSAGGFYQ